MATTERKPETRLTSTISGLPVEPLYSPENVEIDYDRDLGYPGEYPFTRGVYPSMYRGRLWTMRQFAGFGTAEETNERFRYLLEHGQTGLSTAFDMPTLMGYDSDHPRSLGEVGREGVAIDSLEDMETLFAGIPLGEVSTSMTINSPAAMLLAFYVCVGEEQGVPRDELRGTVQTDILKEYIAQKEYIFPPEPSMRLVVDMIEFCDARAAADAPDLDLRLPHPRGGLDRGAGAGVHARRRLRVRRRGARARARRRRVRAAPLLLLQRAHRLLRGDREVPGGAADLGARAARPLRREGPALVADALPHADGRRLADRAAAGREHRAHGARGAGGGARRHAVAAHELVRRGARAADRGRGADRAAHAAGDRARDRRREHDRSARRLVVRRGPDEPARGRRPTTTSRGSRSSAAWSPAIKENFFQREIAEASFRYQSEVERDERVIVGVNRYELDDEPPLEILRIDPALEQQQIERVQALRARRDSAAAESRARRADAGRRGRGPQPDAADRRRRGRT